ncbi:hypothetical protein L2E82_12330 [Cichorium intybus]|uniref:Uncharacterized protein n=1 Tax=Cichorium intybus TaxID=13427 RepID=A0ACB9GGT4_CICIN|nr:hypothetical protein L2E82_12330 [Cichorium intybus]
MGTFESWRRAYGALKDSTTVGLAKVGSDFKDLDIAIVRATNHDECPPKDLHVRGFEFNSYECVRHYRCNIFCCTTSRRRILHSYTFQEIDEDEELDRNVFFMFYFHVSRLRFMLRNSVFGFRSFNLQVAVKTLMVFHRILREGDPSFREELLVYSRRRHIFRIQDFRDDSSQLAWDCSSWIRTYATFLEERLECYRVVGFDIETERLTTAPGIGKGTNCKPQAYGRTRLMDVDELLEQLPAMQQLLFRLIACQPEGAAYHNHLIQHAWALVIKESLKIYSVINDGITRLVESFFDMAKDEAIASLNIYKRYGRQPPPSFLETMEEYVKGISVSNKKLERTRDVVEERPDPRVSIEPAAREFQEVEKKEILQDQEPEHKRVQKVEEEVQPLITIDDDPGLDEANSKAIEIEDCDASRLALTILQPGTTSSPWIETEKTLGWDLALVTTTSNPNNTSPISQGGGFDKLLLYSLYEDDMTKKQIQSQHTPSYNHGYQYGMQHESFHHHPPPPQQDPLLVSHGMVLQTTNVPMVMMQQQEYTMSQLQLPYQQHCQNQYHQQQQQQNMFVSYNNQQSSNQYAQPSMWDSRSDTFGDTINQPQGNCGLI